MDSEPVFADAVFGIFTGLSRELQMKVNKQGLSGVAEEKRIAFEIHQHDIMRERCRFLRDTQRLISNRICLCCLFQVPVHPLLCGHIICDACFNDSGQTLYQFQRFDNPDQELLAWEAARATSAAPGFFKSFYHPRNAHTYQDGALKLNNPILAADYERLCIWGEGPQSSQDVLVSIGTGYFPDVRRRSGDPGPTTGIGFVNGAMVFANIAKDAIESELDCEKTWEDFLHHAAPEGHERRNRFHRLTLPIQGPKIGLDAVDEMENLQSWTKAHWEKNSNLIDKVAGQLIASLFYFDVVSRVSLTVTGKKVGAS